MSLWVRKSLSSVGSIIYWPADAAPRGGIVCLHGSEGGSAGWNDLNCAVLAASGFAAMACRYTESRPFSPSTDIDNIPLEGTEAALTCLREALAPHRCGIGLFGASRGAEQALLLVQLMAEEASPALPDAVAVHSPPDAVWPAFIVTDFQTGKPWAGDSERPAWSWRGGYEHTLPATPLAIERFPNPVFIAQGTEDKVWGDQMAHRLVARMVEAGHPPEAHFFEGEGHVFRPEAWNREWQLLTEFFERHLRAPT